VCLEKRVNSAGDPVAARVGLRNAMTGGMALIAIASAVIGVAIAGGWMVLLAIGFFVMGSGLALPYALAPRLALSAFSPAQAGQGSGIVNACTLAAAAALPAVRSPSRWGAPARIFASSMTLQMSEMGLVSRASPVQTAMRNCTRDEGGPFGFGDQVADPKPPQAAVGQKSRW